MQTITIKSPAIELKIPPKVWVPLAVAVSGTLLFLYFRFKAKKRKQLLEATAKKEEAEEKEEETTIAEKTVAKVEKPVVVEAPLVDITEEVEDFTQVALKQNVHLPALTFNNEWEVIPLLPTGEHPIRYRIFNQAGQAAVEVYLEKEEEITWQVVAEGLASVRVPLHDATQLRALVASFLQQISPISNGETINEENVNEKDKEE